jgi:hypothetical protein
LVDANRKKQQPEIKTRQRGKLKPRGGMFERVHLGTDEPHPMERMFAVAADAPPEQEHFAPEIRDAQTATTVAAPVESPVATVVNQPPTTVTTPVASPVGSPAPTTVAAQDGAERAPQAQTLDATHSNSEKIIYSQMYRDTISKGIRERHFGNKELCTKTGIRSDLTVRKAIRGLKAKLSVEVVSHANYFPLGPRYRVYDPKEVMRRRREAGIEIDPQTKKIISPVGTTVDSPVATAAGGEGKNYRSDPAETTVVGPVETTGLYKSNKNIGAGSGSTASSSSESSPARGEDDDDAFVSTVRPVYERLTGNLWTTADDVTLAKGQGIRAEVWGMAICHCVDRAPGHTFASLAYVLDEAGRHEDVMGNIPTSELRRFLRRAVERLESACLSGEWDRPDARPPAVRPVTEAPPRPSPPPPTDDELVAMFTTFLHEGTTAEQLDANFSAGIEPERWGEIKRRAVERYEAERAHVRQHDSPIRTDQP